MSHFRKYFFVLELHGESILAFAWNRVVIRLIFAHLHYTMASVADYTEYGAMEMTRRFLRSYSPPALFWALLTES
jgi:hypothetical protein